MADPTSQPWRFLDRRGSLLALLSTLVVMLLFVPAFEGTMLGRVLISFVTMSTLGYGDIRPLTPLAETMTWMESVVGQFYLAVLVARLVAFLPRGSSENED